MPRTSATAGAEAPRTSAAEREVAALLPIGAHPARARLVRDRVPFWFHTFALNVSEGVYTPGAARDHRYRVPLLPQDFAGLSVLDVGTFDGFYAFLAEARGARRVIAVDNEQYRAWVGARWGVELRGGEGFREIKRLLHSQVEYRRLDALQLDRLDERFDVVYCFGLLHRVENPFGLLRVLRDRVAHGGRVLVETYGVEPGLRGCPAIHVSARGEVYARDDFVYWGFTSEAIARLADHAGFGVWRLIGEPVVDGHPRVLGELRG